jgi:hypothetical protein
LGRRKKGKKEEGLKVLDQEKENGWVCPHGTLSRLLEPTTEGFPRSPVWLTKRLKEVQSSLSDLGIKVEFGRWEKANYIAITFS